jgi:DNA (cytosine-5)-methyltransferase 1
MAEQLTVGSLFSGIGGLDLGLERAGMRVIWQSEIDPYASRVLNKHWPEVPNYGDIKKIQWEQIQRPDVLCGGYPCQPFSTAGKRRGEEDPRHLWPWVREAISRLRPRYAILENVRGHLSMGGLSVIGELATLGYDAEWRIVSAASVGANHRRDRIVIVAYPNSERLERERAEQPTARPTRSGENSREVVANANNERRQGRTGESEPEPNGRSVNEPEQWGRTTNDPRVSSDAPNVANASSVGGNGGGHSEHSGPDSERQEMGSEIGASGSNVANASSGNGGNEEPHGLREVYRQATELREPFSTSRTLGYWWQTEPDVGRVANGVPARVDRLRGLGNAVVPQVAEVVGRLVIEHANNG